jgi:hypothetical protein
MLKAYWVNPKRTLIKERETSSRGGVRDEF